MTLSEPLFTAEALQAKVSELGQLVSSDYAGREILVLTVLKGSVVFAADLIRTLRVPVRLEFIRVKSYCGVDSTGEGRLIQLPDIELRGRHVLVVEDILDTGRSAAAIMEWVRGQEPASVRMCALLNKPSRRVVEIEAEYAGFVIGNDFVVGYGLDYEEQFRELPEIRCLEGQPGQVL